MGPPPRSVALSPTFSLSEMSPSVRGALASFEDAMAEDDGGVLEMDLGDDMDEGEGVIVTEELVLETTGEEDLVSVTQLILRNQRVSGFSEECAAALPNLANLSLSHNRVKSLASFGNHFGALLELNLNFNRLASLDGLVAPLLAKLFLSTNQYVLLYMWLSFHARLSSPAPWPYPFHAAWIRIDVPKKERKKRDLLSIAAPRSPSTRWLAAPALHILPTHY